jgi:4-hydroxythreonine-4-phosphate dehydrogenase
MAAPILPLAMTMGDPAGVGPIIAWKAWEHAIKTGGRPFYVIAPPAVMEAAARALWPGQPPRHETIPETGNALTTFLHALPVMSIDGPVATPGQPDPATAPTVIESIRLAVEHVQAGKAAAVVTNPIAKALLYRAGFKHPGHTEYLAELAASGGAPPRPIMMLVGGGLRVALVTIHRPLATVPAILTTDLIAETARIVHAAMKRDFGLASPRIGLCGLNPHAGEDGEIGREEIDINNPAAAQLRAEGIDISDARPGDTIFHEMRNGRWDAVIAMYHDQGLIPVKTLDMWGGVNVTLGLPFIRTSPDHGVAYDAAASGKANADSLIAALTLADAMARARAAS